MIFLIFLFPFLFFSFVFYIMFFFERMIARYKTMIFGTKGFIFGSIIIQIVLRRTGAWLRLLVLHFVFFDHRFFLIPHLGTKR